MTGKEHANLLSIFAWIYAGLQGIVVLLYGLFVLIYGGFGISMFLSGPQAEAGGALIVAAFVLIFALIAIIGLACVISNIWMGKRLRSQFPPSPRSMIVAAVLNFVSWICGGVLLMPFGFAIGGYAMWFALSQTGKDFLEGRETRPNYAFPPEREFYPVGQPDQVRYEDPYKWR